MADDISFGDRNSSLQVGKNYGIINTSNSPEGSGHQTHREKALASLKFKEIHSRKLEITTSLDTTCEWLLDHEEYKRWLDEGELPRHHGFFWISGKPGAGKSTIMKFAYLHMKRRCKIDSEIGSRDNPVIASFFFNARGEDLEKSIHGLYRSLLIQIFEGFPDLQAVLDDEDLIPPVAQDEAIACPPLNSLKDLLQNAILRLGQRALTCFIDALDECDENDIVDMIDHFEDLTGHSLSQNSSFRICFSSRPYPHITLIYGIRLTLESQPGHSRDLEFYISNRMKIKDAGIRQKLKSRLLDKAAGVFLWVVLVVQILNKEYRRAGFNLERRLEELPGDLSQLFKAILLRDNENPEALLLCILWILYAKRPLKPEEFHHAVWSGLAMKKQDLVDNALPGLPSSSSDTSDSDFLSPEEPDKVTLYVTSSSKGLAEVTKPLQSTNKRNRLYRAIEQRRARRELLRGPRQVQNDNYGGRRVQFIHESVRDFLIKDKGLSDLWPDFNLSDEAMAHEVLKQCCSFYMDHEMKKTWPSDPYQRLCLKSHAGIGETQQNPWSRSEVCLKNGKDTIPRGYVFLDYATGYVLFHAEGAAKLVPQDDFLSSFPLLYWNETRAFYCQELDSGSLLVGPQDSLFHMFAMYGLPELIRTRRRKDDKVHAVGKNFQHPFFLALDGGYFDAVAALLDLPSGIVYKRENFISLEEADPPLFELFSLSTRELNHINETPLSWAAKCGQLKIVQQLLLDKTVSVNDNDGLSGNTPALVGAAGSGHKDIAGLLLENGADINHCYPLANACKCGRLDTVGFLLEMGADIDHGFPLVGAASGGHEEVVRLLISNGADVTKGSPLCAASAGGHVNVVEILIESGADLQKGHPLAEASKKGHEAIVNLLIRRGADVNALDGFGRTPLMHASEENRGGIVKLLIESGADIGHKDRTFGVMPRQMESLNTMDKMTKARDIQRLIALRRRRQ